MDEFEDSELSAALRERAARTRPPLDVGQAFESVRHRARRRRIRNGIAAGIGGAAAVAAIAIGVGAVTSDRDTVRTPATAPPETGAVVPPPTSEPATTGRLDLDDVHPLDDDHHHSSHDHHNDDAATTTTAGPAATPVTRTYESVGGSITVRLADGRIALVGEAAPSGGLHRPRLRQRPRPGAGAVRVGRPTRPRSASTSSTAGWSGMPGVRAAARVRALRAPGQRPRLKTTPDPARVRTTPDPGRVRTTRDLARGRLRVELRSRARARARTTRGPARADPTSTTAASCREGPPTSDRGGHRAPVRSSVPTPPRAAGRVRRQRRARRCRPDAGHR